jgi:hypothetical protein
MNFPTTIAWGGAGLTGSPRSYLKVLHMLLNKRVYPATSFPDVSRTTPFRILEEKSVDLLFKPRFNAANKDDSIMKTFLPFVEERSDPWSHRSRKQFEGCNFAYGGLTSGEGFPSGRSKGALAWSGAGEWTCFLPRTEGRVAELESKFVQRRLFG